jgi:pyroglutamyl-peptidase
METLAPLPNVRILITAFGSYPGAPVNPTVAIVGALARSRRPKLRGIELICVTLPVVYEFIDARITGALAEARPDAVIHLGLAPRRRVATVETRASNRLFRHRVDASRRAPVNWFVISGGPSQLLSRWPTERIVASMRTYCKTKSSIDAGGYICNQTLYLTLATTRVPAGFIHIPLPNPRRPSRRADSGTPTLLQLTKAVEAAIFSLAANIRHPAKLLDLGPIP